MPETIIEINIEEVKWQKILPDVENIIEHSCKVTLKASGITQYAKYIDISILLTNDNAIKELNRIYRDKDKATNVLSFPQEEWVAGDYEDAGVNISLGDIVFALETIQKEALEQEKNFKDHLTHLVVHGTLHLLGHDHMEPSDAKIMEALEVEILEGLGVDNPY